MATYDDYVASAAQFHHEVADAIRSRGYLATANSLVNPPSDVDMAAATAVLCQMGRLMRRDYGDGTRAANLADAAADAADALSLPAPRLLDDIVEHDYTLNSASYADALRAAAMANAAAVIYAVEDREEGA